MARRTDKQQTDFLRTWLPPAVGASLFLLLYVLGNLNVIRTPPALALDALVLAAMVLFFPLRYVHRLGTRGRLLSALLAAAWILAVFLPVYLRIYPGQRISMLEARPEELPATLRAAGHGRRLNLLIEGHLDRGTPGVTRVARYRLTVSPRGGPRQTFSGDFEERWHSQARGRRETIDVLRSRTATTVMLDNPRNEDLTVTALEIRGRAEQRLTLSLLPRMQAPWWLILPVATALLLAAVAYDRATGAGETAASLAIATGAALTGTIAFQSVAAPDPTFRELFGASIVGALLGGPIGGLVAWSFRRPRRAPRRSRSRAT